MAEAAAQLVDHVIPRVPVRQWVLSFPLTLRSLFAAHPELLASVLQIIHRAIATFLIEQTGICRDAVRERTAVIEKPERPQSMAGLQSTGTFRPEPAGHT
jgi:hypothetical protein